MKGLQLKQIQLAATLLLLAGCRDEPGLEVISFDTATATRSTGNEPTDSELNVETDSRELFPLDTAWQAETGTDTGVAQNEQLAWGVRIAAIDMYQAVHIPLMAQGSAAAQVLPLVEGKDALFRIYVAEDTIPADLRLLTAQVEVRTEADSPRFFVSAPGQVQRGLTDTLDSTLNVTVPGSSIGPGTSVVVSVVESGNPTGDGDTDHARWPLETAHPLVTESSLGPFRVLIVPVRYNYDGSGRLPDLSVDAQRRLRNRLVSAFPARRIEMEILQTPLDWNFRLQAQGGGYIKLLERIESLRFERNAPPDQHYLGLFKPAAVFEQPGNDAAYCNIECITGLSYLLENVEDEWARTCMTLGYLDDTDPDWMGLHINTILHELGHTLGRRHAPSGGADEPDPDFPYAGGMIGVQGYDGIAGQLFSPAAYYDIMGYLEPQWVSDYTWQGMFRQIQEIYRFYQKSAVVPLGLSAEDEARTEWRTVLIGPDGLVEHGSVRYLKRAPRGSEQMPAVFFDVQGKVIATAVAVLVPLGELDGGKILYPPPASHLERWIARARFDSVVLGPVEISFD